jgi:hypothetical protein
MSFELNKKISSYCCCFYFLFKNHNLFEITIVYFFSLHVLNCIMAFLVVWRGERPHFHYIFLIISIYEYALYFFFSLFLYLIKSNSHLSYMHILKKNNFYLEIENSKNGFSKCRNKCN